MASTTNHHHDFFFETTSGLTPTWHSEKSIMAFCALFGSKAYKSNEHEFDRFDCPTLPKAEFTSRLVNSAHHTLSLS